MWLSLPTNRMVGSLFSNDGDGNAANENLPAIFKSKGFELKNLGIYSNNADDFSSQIAELKKANCEILTGVFTPPEFGVFWTQCAQQGYRPKVVTPAKALLFPASVEAMGDRARDLSTEVWWSPHHPFKSGLTGQTSLEFCNTYTAATGKQWTQPIGFKHANLEVAIDVLKRTKKLDPAGIRDAIIDTNYQSLVGPVAWKGGPTNPVPNCCTTPLVGGQWKKGTKFKYDLNVVFNQSAPNIPTDGSFEAIHYT
jgi:branched-chain amino acid transport system substrate-binding protein